MYVAVTNFHSILRTKSHTNNLLCIWNIHYYCVTRFKKCMFY